MTDQTDRRHALAFNAVAPALKAHDQWLPLSVRRAVAEAVLAAVDNEPAPADGAVELSRDALLMRGGNHLAPAIDRLIRAAERRAELKDANAQDAIARVQAVLDSGDDMVGLDGIRTAFPAVQGRCPACGRSSLFLGSGGFVTCARIECSDPCAATDLLELGPEARVSGTRAST